MLRAEGGMVEVYVFASERDRNVGDVKHAKFLGPASNPSELKLITREKHNYGPSYRYVGYLKGLSWLSYQDAMMILGAVLTPTGFYDKRTREYL